MLELVESAIVNAKLEFGQIVRYSGDTEEVPFDVVVELEVDVE